MPFATRLAAGLAAATLGLSLAACSQGGGGGDVATVNGQTISSADFDREAGGEPSRKAVLNQLIQAALIDQYAKDNNIKSPTPTSTRRSTRSRPSIPTGQFDAAVKQQNFSDADVQRSSASN